MRTLAESITLHSLIQAYMHACLTSRSTTRLKTSSKNASAHTNKPSPYLPATTKNQQTAISFLYTIPHFSPATKYQPPNSPDSFLVLGTNNTPSITTNYLTLQQQLPWGSRAAHHPPAPSSPTPQPPRLWQTDHSSLTAPCPPSEP